MKKCIGFWGRLLGHKFRPAPLPDHTHRCARCGLPASRVKYPAGPNDPDIAA